MSKPSAASQVTSNPVRSATKQAVLREQLAEGASIDDLAAALGWQPHAVRAAISGLRRRGLTIASERAEDGRRIYRWLQTQGDSSSTNGSAE